MKTLHLFYLLSLLGMIPFLTSCSSVEHTEMLDKPNGRLTKKAVYVRGERAGISPTAGSDTLMIQGGGVTNGMAEYTFDAAIVPGTYIVSVDVGNYADCPLAEGTRVRLTAVPQGAARGSLIEPIRFWKTDPVRGGIERWAYKFRVKHGSRHIGKRVGVAIWVPGMGRGRNISFDYLQVEIHPNLRTRLSGHDFSTYDYSGPDAPSTWSSSVK